MARRTTRQHHRRAAAGQVDNTHVAPENALAKACPERLRTGLLGGKPLGIGCCPLGPAIRLGAFDIGEYAIKKPVAEAFERLFDAATDDRPTARPTQTPRTGTRTLLAT